MSTRSETKEPAEVPPPPPPFKTIISEGSREIGAQARAAVETILTGGEFASPAQLRKWGPHGAKYFFNVLQQRLAAESQPTTVAAPVQAAMDPGPHAEGDVERGSTVTPRRKGPPITTEHDWTTQQHHRWPTRTRAIFQGMFIAVVLFAGAAMFIRLWPALMAAVQQQIQNWS
jgi:hypothetical protein